jgi:succinate dehydrogenase / fumarate reductase iron-sulfur subunit
MLDQVNERLSEGPEPIAFDHDCREGICGSCGLMINGARTGREAHDGTCQLHMRRFKDGDDIWIEPWRAKAFPVQKDLDGGPRRVRPHHPGGRLHLRATGTPQDANALPIPRNADLAMDAAACIGCGACVAACPNAAACSSPQRRSRTSACYPRASPSA